MAVKRIDDTERRAGPRCCRDCAAWDPELVYDDVGYKDGLCVKHAPGVINDKGEAVWPSTLPNDWCCEFQWRVRQELPIGADPDSELADIS